MNIFKRFKQKAHADGWVVVRVARVDSPLAKSMEARIAEMLASGDKEVKKLIDEFNTKFAVRELRFHNIIPTVGRTRIIEALTGNISGLDEIEINESALGTGTTAPANGNTQLATETYRKGIGSLSFNQNIGYFTAIYLAADTNGTFYEHGIFMDGTGAPNSGVLLSRVLLNAPTGIAKSSIEVLTIEHQITLT